MKASAFRRITDHARRLGESQDGAAWARRAGGLLTALAVILIAAAASEATWRILAPEQGATEVATDTPAARERAPREEEPRPLAGMERIHLFGQPTAGRAEDPEVPAEAQETQLDLALKGVVSTGLEDEGAAIIDAEGRQAVYHAGTEVMGEATLERVEHDRVILSRDGDFEMLTMARDEHPLADADPFLAGRETLEEVALDRDGDHDRDGATGPGPEELEPTGRLESPGSDHAETEDSVAEADVTVPRSEVAELEDRFRDHPQRILELIAIQPRTSGGSIEGFHLSPHGEEGRELMERVGLRDGDVVTAVDGVEVTDQQGLRRLAAELETTSSLRVQVERDGREQELTLRID